VAKQFGFEDLKRILVERVGIPEDEIGHDMTATFDDIGLDSLAFVEIQLAVQQEYGFSIDDDEAQHISSFQDAIDFTNRKLQEQG
jgi:acyl carrier protein